MVSQDIHVLLHSPRPPWEVVRSRTVLLRLSLAPRPEAVPASLQLSVQGNPGVRSAGSGGLWANRTLQCTRACDSDLKGGEQEGSFDLPWHTSGGNRTHRISMTGKQRVRQRGLSVMAFPAGVVNVFHRTAEDSTVGIYICYIHFEYKSLRFIIEH